MIHHGDSLEVLKTLADNSVDAVVTDPPYGLKFMGKKWDYDVPPIDLWVQIIRVLKPGGHLLSFGGTRTYHRMVVSIEDAGFEIRDQIQWIYGSGFPKSLDVSKAIDKAAGAKREVVGRAINSYPDSGRSDMHRDGGGKIFDDGDGLKQNLITAPATSAAKQWQGWGTALKPANEVICLARKPFTDKQLLANLALECQSKLLAEIAIRYLSSSLSAEIQQSIVQWSAGKCTLTPEDLSEVTDMLRSRSVDNSYLNTELLWLNTLDGIWTHANTCTTEMESSLTTDLKILKSLLSNSMQVNTLQSDGPGVPLSASLSRLMFLSGDVVL